MGGFCLFSVWNASFFFLMEEVVVAVVSKRYLITLVVTCDF